MKAIHRKRLEKLATALEQEKIEHKRFFFGAWNVDQDFAPLTVNGCGYAGCAIGQCPSVFPRHWRWSNGYPLLRDKPRTKTARAGERFFGLNRTEFDVLFVPYEQFALDLPNLGEFATAKRVARNIRTFLKRKATEGKQLK